MHKEQFPRIARSLRYNQNLTKSVLEGRQDVVEDNTNYRGARMVLPIMNSIHILEEVKMLTMITTHVVERFQEDAIEQRWHLANEWRSGKLWEQQIRCKLGIRVAFPDKQHDVENST
jgi:hypothetical protein